MRRTTTASSPTAPPGLIIAPEVTAAASECVDTRLLSSIVADADAEPATAASAPIQAQAPAPAAALLWLGLVSALPRPGLAVVRRTAAPPDYAGRCPVIDVRAANGTPVRVFTRAGKPAGVLSDLFGSLSEDAVSYVVARAEGLAPGDAVLVDSVGVMSLDVQGIETAGRRHTDACDARGMAMELSDD